MNEKQIEQALRDYNWMMNEIKRQRGLLNYIGRNVVAQGGIESTLPKAKGTTGDPVAMEVVRRDKNSKWVEKLEDKVMFIQKRIHIITDAREKVVLECLLDGLSMSNIGKHTGLSRTHIYKIKDSIIEQILHFEQNGHFGHKKQKMTKRTKCG